MRGLHEWSIRLPRAEAFGMKGDLQGKARECESVLAQANAVESTPVTLQIRADALACLGSSELAQQKIGAALLHLEESVSLQAKADPELVPKAASPLARALFAAHRDPWRACELAKRARTELPKHPAQERELADIDALLARECSAGSK